MFKGGNMVKIPKLKKKIGSFLRNEDGKISKQSLVKTGIIIASIGIMAKASSAACSPLGGGHQDHCNSPITVAYADTTATGTHNHGHNSHSSHSSHSSHGHCW